MEKIGFFLSLFPLQIIECIMYELQKEIVKIANGVKFDDDDDDDFFRKRKRSRIHTIDESLIRI